MKQIRIGLKLAEPRTWMASILPVAYGSALSWYFLEGFNVISFILLFIGMICVQSLANMFNDYKDYKRAADKAEKSDEKALSSGEANISTVKQMMSLTLLMAVTAGLVLSALSSPIILLVAAFGILVLYLYSGGPKPICYTPFGEITAGITMGIGITATVMFIHAGRFHINEIIFSIPTAIFISMLLLSNNLADWEEDKAAGRRTLPILLGTKIGNALWVVGAVAIYSFGVYFFLKYFHTIVIPPIILLGGIFGFFVSRYSGIEKKRASKPMLMKLTSNLGLIYHAVCIVVVFLKHFLRV